MSVHTDTLALLRALFVAVQGNKGVPADADERVLDAEGLAIKCFFHAISCLYLQRGTRIPEMGANFFDQASMSVLARAAIESFLVFHYVFAEPPCDDERQLRHLSWVLADLLERQKLPVILPESRQKQEQEQKEIDSLRARIQQNSAFQKLSPKPQEAILLKRRWRWAPWTQIARSAGLSQLHADHAYHHLCSYAHSGSVSVLQVRQAKRKEDQQFLGEAALRLVNIALAFLTRAYCAMFEGAQRALSEHGPLNSKVAEWVRIGAEA